MDFANFIFNLYGVSRFAVHGVYQFAIPERVAFGDREFSTPHARYDVFQMDVEYFRGCQRVVLA